MGGNRIPDFHGPDSRRCHNLELAGREVRTASAFTEVERRIIYSYLCLYISRNLSTAKINMRVLDESSEISCQKSKFIFILDTFSNIVHSSISLENTVFYYRSGLKMRIKTITLIRASQDHEDAIEVYSTLRKETKHIKSYTLFVSRCK